MQIFTSSFLFFLFLVMVEEMMQTRACQLSVQYASGSLYSWFSILFICSRCSVHPAHMQICLGLNASGSEAVLEQLLRLVGPFAKGFWIFVRSRQIA